MAEKKPKVEGVIYALPLDIAMNIFEKEKKIFASYLDVKGWCSRLGSIEPIRNAIAHNRPLQGASEKIREYCLEFEKIVEKVKFKI